jgi:DNA-binding response OmpR family regulator
MLNILIAEDEYNVRTVLETALSKRGFNCFVAPNGEKALELYFEQQIDLLITDIMMPYVDGNQLVKRIRQEDEFLPVIMLTALGTIQDKETGYRSGTDHYVVKPIDIDELCLVIQSLLRRAKLASDTSIKHKGIELNYQAKECFINETLIPFPKKEFELLYLLLASPNKIFTRNHIMDEIWGFDSEAYARTVDSHVKKIRSKLNTKDIEIITVRGLGYKGILL